MCSLGDSNPRPERRDTAITCNVDHPGKVSPGSIVTPLQRHPLFFLPFDPLTSTPPPAPAFIQFIQSATRARRSVKFCQVLQICTFAHTSTTIERRDSQNEPHKSLLTGFSSLPLPTTRSPRRRSQHGPFAREPDRNHTPTPGTLHRQIAPR